MLSILKRVLIEIRSAVVLLRVDGPGIFFKQMMRQIYNRSIKIGFIMDLQEVNIPRIEAKIKYVLQLASKEDMEEALAQAKSESEKSIHSPVVLSWLYEDGYHNCYIARTVDTNEPCFMHFIIYPEDDKKVKGRFREWFPKLKEDEVLVEAAYTFEKFRGNRLHPAILADLLRICQEKGFRRVFAQVEKDNIASLKGAVRAGLVPVEEVSRLRILFFTRRKHRDNKTMGRVISAEKSL
jgi:RimJ/RimL family protein N-acetyltransferase